MASSSPFRVSLDDTYSSIEAIIQQDVGNRGIKPLIVSGDLERAACSFVDAKKIIILTGFPCRLNDSPPTESDGPPGAIALAAAALKLSKPTAIITDESSRAVMEKLSEAAGLKALAEETRAEFSLFAFPAKPDWTDEHDARLRQLAVEYDHAIAIERAGRAVDGSYYTMRALKMDHLVAPIDDLLTVDCACSVYSSSGSASNNEPTASTSYSSAAGTTSGSGVGVGVGVAGGSSFRVIGLSGAAGRSTRRLALESVAEAGRGESGCSYSSVGMDGRDDHEEAAINAGRGSPLAAHALGAVRLDDCDYDHDDASSAAPMSARATPEPDEPDAGSSSSSSSPPSKPHNSEGGVAAGGRSRRQSLEGGSSAAPHRPPLPPTSAANGSGSHHPVKPPGRPPAKATAGASSSSDSAQGVNDSGDDDDDDDRWHSLSVAPSSAQLVAPSAGSHSHGGLSGVHGHGAVAGGRKQRINSFASVASAVPYRGDIWTRAQSLASIPTIGRSSTGIGDGGNECGMGKVLPLVQKHIKNGETIACATPCDNLITAGVSNWGGWGLVAAVEALLRFNHIPRMEKELKNTAQTQHSKPSVNTTVSGVAGGSATTPSWGSAGSGTGSPNKRWGPSSGASSSSSSAAMEKQPSSLRPGWGTFMGLPASATTAGYMKSSSVLKMQANKEKEKEKEKEKAAAAIAAATTASSANAAGASSTLATISDGGSGGSGSEGDGASAGSSASAASQHRKSSVAAGGVPKSTFAVLTGSPSGFLLPTNAQEEALAQAMIASGARDGISGNLDGSVDGMPLSKHLEILSSLRGIVEKAFGPAYQRYNEGRAGK